MTNRMEWQPIETAPKDGTRVIVFRPDEGPNISESHVAIDCYLYDCWYSSRRNQQPTHWMPLPLPPLVDHPRPTTPVVDHEGGESEREASGVEPDSGLHMPGEEDEPLGYRIARKAYEETGGPTQGLKDLYKAYLDNEKRVEAKQASRISDLEAEVERLKEDVSRQMEIANSECARAEKAEMERDKWARLCAQETARYEAADAGRVAAEKALVAEREACSEIAYGHTNAPAYERRAWREEYEEAALTIFAAIHAREAGMVHDLTPVETDLLRVLSKNHPDSGWDSREMAAQVGLGYSRGATVQASKALQRLVKLGLAAHLDDKRPIVWVITDAGRSAMNKGGE